LPGLIGWYRAQNLGLQDGAVVATLTDLSGKGNNGTATNNSILYQASRFNGLASVKLDGTGYFSIAGLTGTTGSITFCAVTYNGNAGLFDSAPSQNGQLRYLGGKLQATYSSPAITVRDVLSGLSASSFRLSDAPGRILSSYVNQLLFDSFQQSNDQGLLWVNPTLGSENRGEVSFIGEICEVIIVGGNLTDSDLQRTIQYLINEYQILV
jgi:hypothetical protein